MTDDRIYAPNIHLFAFHLYESEDRNRLWEYYQNTIVPTFSLQPALNLIAIKEKDLGQRLELWKDSNDDNTSLAIDGELVKFVERNLVNDHYITGRVYPLLVYDSYALALNLRIPEYNLQNQLNEPVSLEIFRDFNPNACLLPQKLNSNLGQTILLTAWLVPEQIDRQDVWGEIAQKILANFLGDAQSPPKLYQTKYLFDSPCFEYGSPQYLGEDGKIQHYLVWLFLHEEKTVNQRLRSQADTNLGDCYSDLVDLFFYRHKITTAYQYSRKYYQEIKKSHEKLKNTLNTIAPSLQDSEKSELLSHAELTNLQGQLITLPKLDLNYSEYLQNLKNNHLTIKINNHNYNQKITQIKTKCAVPDLLFLADFGIRSGTKFKAQIMDDLGYFSHGSALVDKTIASIRGIVEINQAEIDRSLERTIQILGVGLGAGGITASAISGHIDKPLEVKGNQIHPGVLSLVVSVAIALIAGGVTAYCLKGKNKQKGQKLLDRGSERSKISQSDNNIKP